MTFIGHYVLLLAVFLIIDATWIGIIANKFYKNEIGQLLLPKPRLIPAAIFYLLYILALLYLVIDPMLAADASVDELMIRAAALGGVMYATYDLTNLSTLKGWTTKLAIVDIVWGIVLTSGVAVIGFMVFGR